MASLGEKVAQLRAQHGWTLKQLSGYSHVSVSHLSAIEKRTRKQPSFQVVIQLAQAFRVPLSYFADDAHADAAALGSTITQLYDPDTARFIASEQSKVYVTLAKQLADQVGEDLSLDAPAVLQVIAEFIKDHKTSYDTPR